MKETTKDILISILLCIIMYMFGYLLLCFIGWSMNPGHWGNFLRALCAFWMLFVTVRSIKEHDAYFSKAGSDEKKSAIINVAAKIDEKIVDVGKLFEDAVKKNKKR